MGNKNIPPTKQINRFEFTKTLMPVNNKPHRLFVNQAMMKGGKTALGEIATFEIEQDNEKADKEYPTPLILTEQLKKEQLTTCLLYTSRHKTHRPFYTLMLKQLFKRLLYP